MHHLLLLVAMAVPALAQSNDFAHIPLPAELSGTLQDAPYRARVPANWNGTLLVWAPGYGDFSMNVAPSGAPLTSPTIEEQLLDRGYALATAGTPVEFVNVFKGMVGNPRRTIMWGLSAGAITTGLLLEKHPGAFDAGIAVAFLGAGTTRTIDDFSLRYAIAYDAVFGWPADKWGPIEDVRDDLSGKEETDIMPYFAWGGSFGEWEFVRLVMRESETAWWSWEPGLAGWAFAGWQATAGRSGFEAGAGGPTAQNAGVVYSLTPEETDYLATLNIDAEALLAKMNLRADIVGDRQARTRMAKYGDFTGVLRRPLLAVHGKWDPIQIPSEVEVYRALVGETGHDANFAAVYVNTWHGPFSTEQYLRALTEVERWLDTGVRPEASSFPEYEGFDATFDPGPWPY